MHLPLFNHSETSQQLLTEIKFNILNSLNDNLGNFNHLVYVNPLSDFATFTGIPFISSVVAHDRNTAIGVFNQIKNFNPGLVNKFETNHNYPL